MHVHCLYWLMSTGLLFQSTFYRPLKSTTGEMMPMHRMAPIWQWGPDMSPLSLHVCLGLVNIGPLWVYVDIIATLTCTICVILLLCFSLCHHPLCPCFPPPYIAIWLPNINEFHQKNCQKW